MRLESSERLRRWRHQIDLADYEGHPLYVTHEEYSDLLDALAEAQVCGPPSPIVIPGTQVVVRESAGA